MQTFCWRCKVCDQCFTFGQHTQTHLSWWKWCEEMPPLFFLIVILALLNITVSHSCRLYFFSALSCCTVNVLLYSAVIFCEIIGSLKHRDVLPVKLFRQTFWSFFFFFFTKTDVLTFFLSFIFICYFHWSLNKPCQLLH